VASDLVEEKEGKYFHTETGEELKQIVAKMSKSLKNVVNPDDVVSKYGADSLRLYEMFMGPLDATKPWTDTGVKGVYNFLKRVYYFFANLENINEGEENKETLRALHQTIKKVGEDIEDMKFNTAISQMMIFINHCYKVKSVSKETAETFAKVLAPFAPHIAEVLWSLYGNPPSISQHEWPKVNNDYLIEDTFSYPVSFNGKTRFQLDLPVDLPANEVEKAALESELSRKYTEGKQIVKVIVVSKKIINIVIK
jgi:leucyl-tRNA synthetase